MQQNRRRNNNWIGWVIFFFVIFGSRFLPPIANWLSQVTGLAITTPKLVAGIVVLGFVISIVSSVVQSVSASRSSNETRLPTGQLPTAPPTPVQPPMSTSRPPTVSGPSTSIPRTPGIPGTNLPPARLPTGEQRLPGPPRFEPIIDPRIFTFGIIGLVVFGGFFFVVFLFAGALP